MTTYVPTTDRRDDVRTLLIALAAVLTILLCAVTVLYASGAVDFSLSDTGPVTTTAPGGLASAA